MQRNQAAMAVLNVSHEEAREVLDAQLAELHVEREAMLDTTAAKLKDTIPYSTPKFSTK